MKTSINFNLPKVVHNITFIFLHFRNRLSKMKLGFILYLYIHFSGKIQNSLRTSYHSFWNTKGWAKALLQTFFFYWRDVLIYKYRYMNTICFLFSRKKKTILCHLRPHKRKAKKTFEVLVLYNAFFVDMFHI